MKFDLQNSICDVRAVGRRLWIVTVALIAAHLAFPASHLAYAQSDAEHQQFLFAYKLLQRGDLAEAAAEFDQYLGRFPRGEKLGDAQYYRALLHRKNGDNERAAQMLEEAGDPTLVPGYAVDLLRGQVLSDLGKFREALAALERIQTDELDANIAVSVLYLKGMAYRGAENLEAAATALADAAELDTPMKPRALLDLAKVLALLEEPAKAVETLDRCLALESPGTQPEAARFAGDLSYNQGKYEPAVAYYGTVVSRYQSSVHFAPSVVGMLWAQFGQQKYRELLTTFDRFGQALPLQDRLPAWYLAGSAHQELEQHEQAVALLSQYARGEGRLPIQEKILYKLAVSQYHLKERAGMDGSIAELARRFPDSPLRVDLAFLQATSDADQGDVTRGADRLSVFVNQGPQSPYYQQALLRRANLYETHEQPAAAARDYRLYRASVTEPSPVSLQATFRLMELAGALGKHEEVKTLATSTLAIGDAELVTPAVEQEAMYRQAVAMRYLGDLEAALAVHEKLTDRHPLNPYRAESGLERGLIQMKLGDPEGGVALLRLAADEEKLPTATRVSVLRIIAQHAEEQGAADESLALRMRMQELADASVFNPQEMLWIGRTLLGQGKAERALAYLAHTVDEGLQDQARYLTGRAQRLTGQHEAALETLGEVRALRGPNHLFAWLEISLTLRDQGNLDEALRELRGLLNSDKDQRIASRALYEAGLMHRTLAARARQRSQPDAEAGHVDEARRLLKMIVLLHADRAGEDLAQRASVEVAELERQAGDAAEEAKVLNELVVNYPGSAYAIYARGVLALRAGQRERAAQFLRQALEQTEDAALKRRAEAQLRSIN
ncbi:MAG: tetratricopeptide repeat protein [Planctomycetota bacterium]